MSRGRHIHAERLAHRIVRQAQQKSPGSTRSASLFILDEMTASADIAPEMSKLVEKALEKYLARVKDVRA